MKPHKRHQLIYDLLRRGGPMSVTEVLEALLTGGHKLIRKTIERDLKVHMAIDANFGLCSTDGERPERFYIKEGHAPTYQVALSELNIQVLALAISTLKKTTAVGFEKFIDEVELAIRSRIPKNLAQALLSSHEQQIVQYGKGGRAKKLPAQILNTVFRALREHKAMTCHYQSISSPLRKDEVRTFAPFALELFDGTFYILATDLAEPDHTIKRLKLSRFTDIQLLAKIIEPPSPKEYESYLHNYGALGGPSHKAVRVQLTGDTTLAELFENREFSPDQVVKPVDENNWEITLTTADSLPLARLLAGYGGNITSIQPKSLRTQVMKLWETGLKAVG